MPVLVDEETVRTGLDEPAVWPDLSQAASIIGLTKSTLSKRASAGQIEYRVLGFGRGRHVLSPREILRIGRRYHRVPEETLVERLAAFLSPHLGTEPHVVYRVLLRDLDETVAGHTLSTSQKESPTSPELEARQPAPGSEPREMPKWLLEVDGLRENPDVLAGCFSFVSPDDLTGHIHLGPSVDDMPTVTPGKLPAR